MDHPLILAVVVDDQAGRRVRMVPPQGRTVRRIEQVRQVGFEIDPDVGLDDTTLRVVSRWVDQRDRALHQDAEGLSDRRPGAVARDQVLAPDAAAAPLSAAGAAALDHSGGDAVVLLLHALHEATVASVGARRMPLPENIGQDLLQLRLRQVQLLAHWAHARNAHVLAARPARRHVLHRRADLDPRLGRAPRAELPLGDLAHPKELLGAAYALPARDLVEGPNAAENLQAPPVDHVRRRRVMR
mmetsp:Transcript_67785/g.207706  ORF Transcript_67785/g.207706 Transcript_67785/m.207706 type:complete len:243 (-) Transcript_67785:231-959(-)